MRAVLATRNEHKLRELSELLRRVELEPLPPDVRAAAGDGHHLRRQRAGEGARGGHRHRHARDRRRLGDRGRRARRRARACWSARYAGEGATDEENLAKLLREVPADDRRVSYVCALVYVEPGGREEVVHGRCDGMLADEPRGDGGFGYDPAFVPSDLRRRPHHGRARPRREGRDQPPRPGRPGARPQAPGPQDDDARPPAGGSGGDDCDERRWRQRSMLTGAAVATTRAVGPDAQVPRKDSAAAVSIASNALLIVLKLAAAAVTGSIAILTEAAHSSIDLIASVVAFYSVRKADEPADEDHPTATRRSRTSPRRSRGC